MMIPSYIWSEMYGFGLDLETVRWSVEKGKQKKVKNKESLLKKIFKEWVGKNFHWKGKICKYKELTLSSLLICFSDFQKKIETLTNLQKMKFFFLFFFNKALLASKVSSANSNFHNSILCHLYTIKTTYMKRLL